MCAQPPLESRSEVREEEFFFVETSMPTMAS